MSSKDYDEVEKLFCGTWKVDRDENMEAFMVAAEIPEGMKNMIMQQRVITNTREGSSVVEKSVIGGVEYKMALKLNEVIEWKEKEEDPLFHVKVLPTFKDGVWTQDTTPQTGGKRHVFTVTVQGDELIVVYSIPDEPSVTGKRICKK